MQTNNRPPSLPVLHRAFRATGRVCSAGWEVALSVLAGYVGGVALTVEQKVTPRPDADQYVGTSQHTETVVLLAGYNDAGALTMEWRLNRPDADQYGGTSQHTDSPQLTATTILRPR